MNIYQKLIEVRKTVPYLKKDNTGNQFKYVSSSQTLGTLKEKMDEMGLLLIPGIKSKNVSDHSTKSGGHEYFTELEMQFTWVNSEKPDETIVCDWYGQGLDTGEKGVGKALTYSEKYFLLKFFNIATDKDDPDSFQDKIDGQKNNIPTAISEDQLNILSSMITDNEVDSVAFLKWMKRPSLSMITSAEYDKALNALKAKISAKNKEKAA